MPARQIVVTLTSIPPRFGNLPRKFASLARQTIRPDRVELQLPREYRRFPGPRPALPPLPDWVHVMETDTDLGPATKVLPAVRRWRGTATDLLICDDDRLQDAGWIGRFVEGRKARPDDILCERGWNIEDRFGLIRAEPDLPRAHLSPRQGRTLAYRLKRIASLNLAHPARQIYASPGHVDVFEGFLGALMPANALPDAAFDIPDIVWTVDDVWLSGMAWSNGVRVWAHGLPRPVYSDGRVDKLASLRDHVEKGLGRENSDRYAVDFLREHHGVWP
jgi:hypothetical protein